MANTKYFGIVIQKWAKCLVRLHVMHYVLYYSHFYCAFGAVGVLLLLYMEQRVSSVRCYYCYVYVNICV